MYYGTPPIITNGLVLALDSLNPQSIPTDPTVNLKTFSQDYTSSGANYNFDNITATSSFIAPDGTSTATLFTETTSSGVHRLTIANTLNVNFQQNKYYTLSFYAKNNGRPSQDSFFEFPSGRAGVIYNLSTNTFNTFTTISASIYTASFSDVGNGWYRISYTARETASIAGGFGITLFRTYNESGSGSYAGNGLSGSYFWGLQIEQNIYPTPYVASIGNNLGSRTTWNDLSGNNNFAVLSTASISSSIPQYNFLNERVLNFDGSGSNAVLTRPVQDDFTLSCWIKTTQPGPVQTQWYNAYGLLDCEVGGYQNDFGLAIGGGRVIFGVGNPNLPNDISIYSTQTYNDGKWHYAVATRVKSTGFISLYVDSILVASGSAQTGSLTTSSC